MKSKSKHPPVSAPENDWFTVADLLAVMPEPKRTSLRLMMPHSQGGFAFVKRVAVHHSHKNKILVLYPDLITP